jgi:DNA polymerase III sliding clamp (beta) subunit (PCNA family)
MLPGLLYLQALTNNTIGEKRMKVSTLKAIVAAFNTASKDQTRFNLTGVLIEREEGNLEGVNIIGCDGHKLSVSSHNDLELYDLIKDKKYFVTQDDLKIIKLLLKDFSKLGELPCKLDGDTIVIGLESMPFVARIKPQDAQGVKYPDYRQVMPRNEDLYSVEVSFNPEYLLQVAKSLKDIDSKGERVTLKINPNDKTAAIMVKSTGQGMGLVMPMRV